MNHEDPISRAYLYDSFVDAFEGMELITLQNALELIEDAPTVPPQVVHEDGDPTREAIAAEYLNLCGEDCYGDDSVGIPACPFAKWPDDDTPCLCSCALKSIIGAKMDGGEDNGK